MLIKVINGTPQPYSIGALKKDNPGVSLPKQLTDEVLAAYDVYNVRLKPQPSFEQATENCIIDTTPVLEDGAWVLNWIVSSKTPDEIQQYRDNCAMDVRLRRNELLTESDWVITKAVEQNAQDSLGVQVPQQWLDYRQALRDITDHANFPILSDADWPVAP